MLPAVLPSALQRAFTLQRDVRVQEADGGSDGDLV